MTTGDKTRALSEWAFFTSLAVTIGLAGIYLPPLYFLATVFLPLPVLLLVLRLDTRYGVLGLAAAGLFLLILVPEPMAALILIIHYGMLGILYGLLFKNHVSSGKNIAAGLLGTAFLALLSVALIIVLTGQNPFVLGQESRRMAEQWLAANQSSGAFNGVPPEWQGDFGENMIRIFELFIPGQFIVTSAAAAAFTYFLARAALRRLNFFLPPPPVFTRMFFPWYSVWGLIIGLGLTLAGDHFALQLAAKIGKNILFILFYVYLALGLSVTVYFARRVKLAGPIKIVLLFLALVYFPFSTAAVLTLGVVDPLINFRRLPAEKD